MSETESSITFAKKAKNELADGMPKYPNAKKALLSGLTRNAASLSIGSHPSLTYRTELSKVAKLIFNLLKSTMGITPRIVFQQKMRFDKSIVYVVIAEGKDIYQALADLKVQKNLRPTPIRAMANPANIKYFATGLFLATGSVNSPNAKSYILEITMNSQEDANALADGLKAVNERFSFKVAPLRDKWMVYLKKSSEISEFLAWLGAMSSTMEYENARITKDYFNNQNRLNICDAANYSKSLKAAQETIQDIQLVLSQRDIKSFDAKTQAVWAIRLANQELSYGEIAQEATKQGFSITKSGVARLFRVAKEQASVIRRMKAESKVDK